MDLADVVRLALSETLPAANAKDIGIELQGAPQAMVRGRRDDLVLDVYKRQQRAFLGVGQVPHLRQQPGDAAFTDGGDHGRQADRIVRFPRVAHEQAGDDVRQRQPKQNQPGQFRGGHGRQPGRSGTPTTGSGKM